MNTLLQLMLTGQYHELANLVVAEDMEYINAFRKTHRLPFMRAISDSGNKEAWMKLMRACADRHDEYVCYFDLLHAGTTLLVPKKTGRVHLRQHTKDNLSYLLRSELRMIWNGCDREGFFDTDPSMDILTSLLMQHRTYVDRIGARDTQHLNSIYNMMVEAFDDHAMQLKALTMVNTLHPHPQEPLDA